MQIPTIPHNLAKDSPPLSKVPADVSTSASYSEALDRIANSPLRSLLSASADKLKEF